MDLLVTSFYFPPDLNSTGVLVGRLCRDLAARGHGVQVLTTFPHYGDHRVWPEYRGRLREVEDGSVRVLRHFVYAGGSKERMLSRGLSYLTFNSLALLSARALKPYDLVFCPSPSLLIGLTASLLARRRGVPFVYNVQDLYPAAPVRVGQLRNRTAIRLLERLERLIYRRADHITVISEGFRRNLLGKGVPPQKITLVPNFVDTDFIQPASSQNGLREDWGLSDRFVVSYQGYLGFVYDFETVLDAAQALRAEEDIVFLIVGNGVARSAIEAAVSDRRLPNVQLRPWQPEESLPLMRALADVQLSPFRPGAADVSLPSKLYEIMASGRPVLAAAEEGSDIWMLVTEAGAGYCVEPGSASALTARLRELRDDPALRRTLGQRGRQYVLQRHSRPVIAGQYEALFTALVEAQPTRGDGYVILGR